ncbi:competence protein ComGC [Virgibacillus subterraneus]|uniref:ComG operon protein 3 n=2 Tax=Virgibacillus TaxID=84406 RepID=A0A1H1BF73_9BACI|nr:MULTISPECIES: competence type IV pilus major pilin ComGC [Virgibacillus]SDQ50547.1 competence protein ComGC [Virgibacillus salinus]SEQ19552.1 competence protein ComGC [Virgibacillus subterraneus]
MFNSQKGFTLIEMLIVLMIISVLIILMVPNLSDKSKEVYEKGCNALVNVVQAQVDAYYIEKNSYPVDLEVLETSGYITEEQKKCPNNTELQITNTDGKAIVSIPSGI